MTDQLVAFHPIFDIIWRTMQRQAREFMKVQTKIYDQ